MLYSYFEIMTQDHAIFVLGDYIVRCVLGADWQSQKPNLWNRDEDLEIQGGVARKSAGE